MRVAAIVITYNRHELLKECLDSILSGTVVPDVIVVDNASTDNTPDLVKNYPVKYVRLENNLGPAGGAEAGQRYAYENKYDFVWMLDDDVVVSKDALYELLHYYDLLVRQFNKIFLSSVTYGDKEFKKPFYNLLRYDFRTGLTKKIRDEEFHRDYFEYDIAPMNGLFIPREVFDIVGFFNGKLWGWYDDTEFVLRSKKVGFRGFAITKSKIYHPIEYRKQVKILGKTFTILSGRPYRMYLGTRNNITVQKKFLKPWNFYFIFLPAFIFKRFISIVFFYDNKKEFLKNFFRGIIDGLKEKLEVQNV
ncbi:glycosyltransferase [Caldisericum exile]|uniref:Glycosyltransferase n=1 Tax=Caldisericum exile (strain DSM 21853 / NBRC 104410 / AZM16c01) TaxID=511051 RepID=A0A7U6GDT2_CALEA|nr:glycosyltransferase [Caldisericum exile]BAL80558.1 putative glycosyltransferase [Caldisericum exile AZM16c01]